MKYIGYVFFGVGIAGLSVVLGEADFSIFNWMVFTALLGIGSGILGSD